MNFAEIAEHLLAYTAVTTANVDAQIPEVRKHIRSGIFTSLGIMFDRTPGLFALPEIGAILAAPATAPATVASDRFTVTLGTADTVPNAFCTLRFASGSVCDHTVTAKSSSTVAAIAPAFTGTTLSGLSATVYHDALLVPATYGRIANSVFADGVPLEKVGNRTHAFEKAGDTNPKTRATGIPLYWWEERAGGRPYICVYPLPAAMTGISYAAMPAADSVALADVFTDTETFGLDERDLTEILLPLSIARFAASPYFASPSKKDVIGANEEAAMSALVMRAPKASRLPCFP